MGLQRRADHQAACHPQTRDTGARELVSLRWGLVPFWAKDRQAFKGISTINARAETITTSRT
jgi:putative SOS response-associated peptidase YedK